MKKKAFIFIGLCVIGLHTWAAQANTSAATPISYELNNVPNGYDEIVLRGELAYGTGPNAIVAGEKDDEVYIQFNQCFGNVNIVIFNSNGQQVYSTVVDTSIQQVVIIPFSNTAVDTYTIELNQANRYAEGEFERN